MKMAKNLYKTTIVIWSDFEPRNVEIDDLAREAVEGASYCSVRRDVLVRDTTTDPEWDGTEFFGEE